MSYEAMTLQYSVLSNFVLNRSLSKQRSPRTLMKTSTRDVEAAFLRMRKEIAREMSSVPARLGYIVGMVAREEDAAVK